MHFVMAAISRATIQPLVFTAQNLAEGANKFQNMYVNNKDKEKSASSRSARARKNKEANSSIKKPSKIPAQERERKEIVKKRNFCRAMKI